MYFNPGPARLPYHHEGILSYCRELNVPLEVMCNDNRGALMQDDAAFGGSRSSTGAWSTTPAAMSPNWRPRRSTRTCSTEPVSTEDKETHPRLPAQRSARWTRTWPIAARPRRLREAPAAATRSGTLSQPLDLRQLLASDFWQGPMQFGEFSTIRRRR